MSNIKICSFNCQGLGAYSKRRDVFQYLKQKKYSIYFLQDTHFDKKIEKQIRSEWGYECFFASFTTQSRGVAILLNNNFDFKIKNVTRDPQGNYIILTLKTMEKEIVLINVYGPNRDEPEFYDSLINKIKETQNLNVIMAGDFNLVLNPTIDYNNYKHINNPKAQEKLIGLISELDLCDVWREINPEIQRFTWRRNNPLQQARLDFCLIAENLITHVKDADIIYGYRSDHSIINLELEFKKETRFKNYWKFNSTLLRDLNYINKVHETIKEIKKQYTALVYNKDEIEKIPIEDLQLLISDQLFFDTLIMEIRKMTLEYSAKRKKEENRKEQDLENEINKIENKIIKTEEELRNLQEKKDTLIGIRKTKMDGILLRSKARYASQGEHISKYYCNMEKRHFISKQMFKLINKKGETLDRTEDMLNETKQFYEQLYKKRNVTDIDLEQFVKEVPKLTELDAETLEGPINLIEASNALKNMTNGKSPGTDGITVEFLKFFWKQLGQFVVRSLNEGYEKGSMSITQREGMIVCLPKGDKPREFLTNWRPISLLNVVYKIGSSCIANRIKTVLPSLINEDQTGFVAGRYIGDNLRLLYDVMHYLNDTNSPGLLVSLDFEKAFDSVSWSFMLKVLKFFGFKESICQWVSAFYTDIKSFVIVNGLPSSSIPIERGCRQGDPVSPYLFILCAEILACKIRENFSIKGVKINDEEFKISQFADDTTLLLEGDKESYEELFKELNIFENISGLKLNYDKTCNVWLGSLRNSKDTFLNHIQMAWNPPKFKILGLWFNNSLENMAEMNMNDKFKEIRLLFNTWSKRSSTPLGRVAVLKSLILSKLIYLWMLLPNPPNECIKQLQTQCFEFVWDKKRDKVKRNVAIHSIEDGGINIPYIKAYIKALKLIWLRKVLQNYSPKWKHILTISCPDIQFADKMGPDLFKLNKLNPFWKDVFEAYKEFYDRKEICTDEEILAEPLFFNNKFKINNNIFNFKTWTENSVYLVKDLVKEDGSFMSLAEFTKCYDFKVQMLEYFGCISAIKDFLLKLKVKLIKNDGLKTAVAYQELLKSGKGSKCFYNVLIGEKILPNACKNWNNLLSTEVDWPKVFKKTKKIKEIKLRWFQMRIYYRILVTNSVLKEMGLTPNNMCNFCKTEKDTIIHYLWQCPFSQRFWDQFVRTLKDNCDNCARLVASPTLVLFGSDENIVTDQGFDFLLIQAKFFVYKCRINKIKPDVCMFLKDLKNIYRQDMYAYYMEMNSERFGIKWASYLTLVEE